MILESVIHTVIEGRDILLRVRYIQEDTPWYLWLLGRRYQEGGRIEVMRMDTEQVFNSEPIVGTPNPVKIFDIAWQLIKGEAGLRYR